MNKNIRIGYKLFFGLLGLSAVITELAVVTERGVFNPGNFFGFFTIQNNILIAATFLLSAVITASGKTPSWLDKLRGATTTYIAVVGIGFAVLLAGLENTMLTAVPWDNIVLHYIIPVAAVLDFVLDKPKTKLNFKKSLWWLLYPAAYVAYSLIRGSIVGWYPYPFLNPNHRSYGEIAITVAGLLLLSVIVTWAATWVSARPRVKRGR